MLRVKEGVECYVAGGAGPSLVTRLMNRNDKLNSTLPEAASLTLADLTESLRAHKDRIDQLDEAVARRARKDKSIPRLQAITG